MKIEKINDNQIRCTLTRADLIDRQLKLSELAYGSEKAKSLFQDMMQQAAYEFGFEADDTPLMIEAIPSTSDSIVLIITKVDDPEELDTRFSKFAPSLTGDTDAPGQEALEKLEGAEDFLNLLNKVKKAVGDISTKPAKETEPHSASAEEHSLSSIRLFSFGTLDTAIYAAHLLKPMYDGRNTLYKDDANSIYILALTKSEHTTSDFNKICNMLSEYGSSEKANSAVLAYLEEHCETIVSSNAIQKLASL